MLLYGTTIFLSAFLLFLVQPILAKLILPQFGGGVAVWATCLVFFQSALLLGYSLAHQLIRHDAFKPVRWLHAGLLLASLALLPIIPQPLGPGLAAVEPSLQILALLALTIGLPFTLLATTSPLLQAWVARAHLGGNPYRLFAVSNLASLAALVAYPWLIEPWLRNATQARVWSLAYAAYVLLVCALALRRPAAAPVSAAATDSTVLDDGADEETPPAAWPQFLGWTALAGLASYELVAVTNHLTQNIPSIPMMWVLPLVAYLLSFALCFDGDRWYRPRLFHWAMLVAIAAMCGMLWYKPLAHQFLPQTATFMAGLFVVCMWCHGELARSRPRHSQLTQFYLCVSAGGVIGGALVGLAAPALLPGYFEVEIGLILLALAVLGRAWKGARWWSRAATLAVLGCAGATAQDRIENALHGVVSISRNFYGVVRVREYGSADDPENFERTLTHGSILHGEQYLAEDRRRKPTSYYVKTSGVGLLLQALGDRPIDVGVVGLGAGTLATYGKAGDRYRFYEIDGAVVDAARRYFSYLGDSAAQVDVQLGDGRLLLQAEATQRFDVLAVDAFSGDSIPVHLLTREAVALYAQRMKPGGVIALHVSNRFLDLRPVVGQIAADLGLQLQYIEDHETDESAPEKASSDWILLARNRSVLDLPALAQASRAMPAVPPRPAWTDDYSNIVQVMSFGKVLAGH